MVKCSECGFLASRDVQTRQLEETEQEIRMEGCSVVAWNTGKPTLKFEPPICFMRAPDYKAIPFSLWPDKDKDKVRSEIQRERDCEFFTHWQQGFTPKEHREMLDRIEILNWQAEREQKDREFREREQLSNKRYRIVELVLVIVTIIAVLSAAFIERGGQPTINIITPNPESITIEHQP